MWPNTVYKVTAVRYLRGCDTMACLLPDGFDSKVQASILCWNPDRSIMTNYHKHKVALSHLRGIPNQVQQRSVIFVKQSDCLVCTGCPINCHCWGQLPSLIWHKIRKDCRY